MQNWKKETKEMNKKRAERIVQAMYNKDAFSQWLGIELGRVEPGGCLLRMTVRHEMCNGFGIAHGGITYSLADSALAFASNGHGPRSVSVETSISHTVQVRTGDILTATTIEDHRSRKIGIYRVVITNQDGETVALFRGTVYRTSKEWEV